MVSGTGLIAVSYGMVRYGYGLQLPQLAAEFSLSTSTAGAIASGSFAAYCLAALTAQRLMPRRGARVVLWIAALLAAAGALLVAVAWSAPVLAAGVLVAGSAAGAASPALVVAVAATVREPLVARAQAVVNAGTGVGVAVAGVATLAAPQVWRPVWVGAAVAALATAAVVDRLTRWPDGSRETGAGTTPEQPGGGLRRRMVRPVLAAALAGTGSAAVWTFGRDLVTTTGGLPERTTAALWCLLGVAAVLGALSGDAVRRLGLGGAWVLTAVGTALGTALLALAPGQVLVAALAGALFGGAYTALSGVLIAWGAALRPRAAGQATATLFTALTAGQALGATVAGTVAARAGAPTAFWVGAALLVVAAGVVPRRAATDRRPVPTGGRPEVRVEAP
ncbi:MFS transporter [Auraticoccus monumenti]|uniref:MFS transporter n=1 Tax=Auraticoccus monumenti TaxID=675864 RepID=UPI0018D36883|nr:MFS transporter [Auraticoccus monumenti]